MKELAIYEPVELTEIEKTDIEKRLSEAYKILEKTSLDLYNFANIKKLRNEYKNGTIQLSGDVKSAIDDVISLEKRVISGYIRMSVKLCRKSRKRYGITAGDYFQEAAMAIYDAMYLYNGKTRFSTYAFWCFKNRIIDFYKKESEGMAFNDAVSLISMTAIKSARTRVPKGRRDVCGVVDANVFNTLTGKAGENFNFENINPAVIECMVTSIYQRDETCVGAPSNNRAEMLWDAIEAAPLTDMERCLIEAEINQDSGFRTRTSETVINPNTGKLWTKQRLSQLYIRACEKIRVAMSRQLSEAA